MDKSAIIFIGPQGSGKGTQAKILAKTLGFFYFETGAIARSVAGENTPLGQQVKAMVNNGILLPDEIIFQMVKEKLSQTENLTGVIFDGLPRRLTQAEFLLKTLAELALTHLITLYISLPKDVSIERLLKRAEIEKRADDTLEKIQTRLLQYEQETVPVLEFLKSKSTFVEIDGTPDVNLVTTAINEKLSQI
jgi:adenylate kinase